MIELLENAEEIKKFIEERAILVETDWRHDDSMSFHIITHNHMAKLNNMLDNLIAELKEIDDE